STDLRVADLEVGLVVEIGLVDGPASGDDQQFFHHDAPIRMPARASAGVFIAGARSVRAGPASWRRTPARPTVRWRPARWRARRALTRRSSPHGRTAAGRVRRPRTPPSPGPSPPRPAAGPAAARTPAARPGNGGRR